MAIQAMASKSDSCAGRIRDMVLYCLAAKALACANSGFAGEGSYVHLLPVLRSFFFGAVRALFGDSKS